MSVRPDPVIPETRRRRASTTEKSERILKMSRSLTLTRSVLAGTLAEATPNQLDFIERWFTAELDSRERSKRLRLLKQAGFPADKTLDGYDWTNLKMPADWGRAQLENLDFVAGCEDLVLYGDVGCGKTHMAIATGMLACERGMPVRFFTASWTGNGVLDRFLEDESLFGEFLRTPVSEGGVESLVVEPPHIVVEVGA